MKRKSVTRMLAATITISMLTVGLTGCGGSGNNGSDDTPAANTGTQAPADEEKQNTAKPATNAVDTQTEVDNEAEEEAGQTVLTEADGNVYELDGMEIIIREWWSPEEPNEPNNAYEEAVGEWGEWGERTYNFKSRELGISEW